MRSKRKPFGKLKVLKRDNYICQYCGKSTTGVDHINPISFKEDNRLSNMVTCCSECNTLASNFLFKNFIEKKDYILAQKKAKGLSIPDSSYFPELPLIEFKKYMNNDDLDEDKEFNYKLCEQCNKKFIPKRFWEKFCSIECQLKYLPI